MSFYVHKKFAIVDLTKKMTRLCARSGLIMIMDVMMIRVMETQDYP